jgi:hypothetical protein
MKKTLSFACAALMVVIISGCSPIMIDYSSEISNPIRVKSNIFIKFDGERIHQSFQDPDARRAVVSAIKNDLQKNLFFTGTDEVDIVVKIETLDYSNAPWGLIWAPLTVIGLPTGRVEASAALSIEVRSLNGQLLRNYRSTRTESHWYNSVYYNRSYVAAYQGGITSEVLKKAIEEIKYKIIEDRYQIVKAVERYKNEPKGVMADIPIIGGVSDVDRTIPKTQMENPDAIAVIFGIGEYQDPGVPKVEHAKNDAAVMRQYLIRVLGYDEKNILPRNQDQTITAGVMKTIIRQQLPSYLKTGVSDVFIYYSGHGAPSTTTQKAFFVPADCNPNFVNPDNAYMLDDFYDDLAKLNCRNLTVVLDACFSGLTGSGEMLIKNASPLFLTVEHPLLTKENAVLMTASKSDQVSNWFPEQGHGLFTYFLLKGLQGGADANADGIVTIQELENFVNDPTTAVPYWARREFQRPQTPQIIARDKEKVFVKY